jgi:carbonic anhydrase
MHRFEYDFTKNFTDHISQRPGIDFVLDPKIDMEMKKALDRSQPCEFGKKQTPINLSTKMPVLKDFKDKEFSFHYNEINQKAKQLKFNEVGDAFFFDIAKGKSEKENLNCIKTQTISLFDPHIPVATLHGAQFHFHAPSEHSIDGKLLDLEMHIVHLLDSKREHNNSQFGAGVLGFFFKVMPEEYFEEMEQRYPQADIEWHDKFMVELVEDPNKSSGFELDLKQFVSKVEFNKRWTYQGSLTTAPCDEGILWNVIEGVIPIRQSTLDRFTSMRRVEHE